MDKQKQIEEMSKDIVRMAGLGVSEKAEYLYEAGYRKIPEKAVVVLTREEHQKYLAFKIIEPQIRGCLDRERILERTVECLRANAKIKDEHLHVRLTEQVRKETAEKFSEKINQAINAYRKKIGEDDYVVNARRLIFEVNEICKEFTGELR